MKKIYYEGNTGAHDTELCKCINAIYGLCQETNYFDTFNSIVESFMKRDEDEMENGADMQYWFDNVADDNDLMTILSFFGTHYISEIKECNASVLENIKKYHTL